MFSLLSIVDTRAKEDYVIKRTEWKADETIVTFKEDYSYPKEVVLTVVDLKDTSYDPQLAIKELYYFLSSRSIYGDLPFHYLVDWEGNVYQGNSFGNEALIEIDNRKESLFVAYINNDESFSVLSLESLKKICLEVINEYSISPSEVEIKKFDYEFYKKSDQNGAKLADVSEEYIKSFSAITKYLEEEYSPKEKEFKVKVTSVEYTKESLDIGEIVDVSIGIRNVGDYNIYASSLYNLFVVRDKPFDEKSSFYFSDEWDSPSRVSIFNDGDKLLVGKEEKFVFKVKVPLYFPEKQEEFILVDSSGKVMKNTDFKIGLKINQGDNTLIEISETPVGFLNVRETPGLGTILTKVSPGERYIVLESRPGYYKIEANGITGWISSSYAVVI